MMTLPSASGALFSSFICLFAYDAVQETYERAFIIVRMISPCHSFPLRFQRGDPRTEFPDLLKNVATTGPAGSLFADEIHLVQVTTNIVIDGIAKKQIWAAEVSRKLAVALVLGAVPEGWTATLSEERLTPHKMALLKMRPGDVREWKKSDPPRPP
jgi:hypothetical protein